jgi:formylglycine-generating enzyme required for sulfatase activity
VNDPEDRDGLFRAIDQSGLGPLFDVLMHGKSRSFRRALLNGAAERSAGDAEGVALPPDGGSVRGRSPSTREKGARRFPSARGGSGPRADYLGSPAVLDRLSEDPEDEACWVALPGGLFVIGASSDEGANWNRDPNADSNEGPPRLVSIGAFTIGRFPVTNKQYAAYLDETGAESPEDWHRGRPPEGKDDHPVAYVSAEDAERYCVWLTQVSGTQGAFGLPTEAEWEYAARGVASFDEDGQVSDYRPFPWGEAPPDADQANFAMNVGTTTPVDTYARGGTPEGVFDLAGNVWEWCADFLGRYKGIADGTKNPSGRAPLRAVRGGSFLGGAPSLRCAYRSHYDPRFRDAYIGFRVVWRSGGPPDFGP